jgi:hypothetical protein
VVTEEDIIQFVRALPGVVVVTAGADNGAPEVSWGDTFFFYDPDGDTPGDRRLPFATIVTQDYAGFDTASDLNRPGVFRLSVSLGRDLFQEVLGYPPAAHAEHHGDHDYTVADRVFQHPVYAAQGWVSVVNPDAATADHVQTLLTRAHAREIARHDRRH